MRFWASKIRTEEKNWSVILNPLRGELDKKRVAEKMSELFRLSFEEARELVESTPLILLDQLPRQSALQLQNIFQEIRVEVTLTSDSLVKRRCYRAIWPEPPDLSFLSPAAQAEDNQEEHVEDLMLESGVGTRSASVNEESTEISEESLRHLEKRYRELELLYEKRMQEIQELRQGFDNELKQRSHKDSTELQGQLQDWEDRYQNLKEEYQETKAIYEEKIIAREREFEVLKERLKELDVWKAKAITLEKQNEEYKAGKENSEGKIIAQARELDILSEQIKDLHLWQGKVTTLERQNREFLEKFNHLESVKQGLEQSVKEQSEAVDLWREKYQGLVQKSDRLEALYEEERRRREQVEEARRQISELAERTRQNLEIQVAETERWRKSFQELDQSQKRSKEEYSQLSAEKDNEIRQLSGAKEILEEKFNHLESVKQGLEQSVKEQSEAVDLWREKYQGLVQKSDRLEALYEEERRRREQVEEARRQISELAERTRQNLEIQVAETERWRKSFQELDQSQKRSKEEYSQLSAEKDNEIRQLRQSNQALEKQFESAQRQVRDLLFRVEQLDLIEKRTRLTNELAVKEARLRELMSDEDRLRQEVQDRGLRAQVLEGEQATLEREILEIRQTQRHVSEQTKMREKNNKGRRPAGSEAGADE